MSKLGFVGLGVMGGYMSSRLLKEAESLAVYDVRPEAMEPLIAQGALACDSPAGVADQAEIVFMSLPTPDVVAAVVSGPGGVLEGGAVQSCIDLSTTGPTVAVLAAAACAARGVGYLDSPVSGGPNGARDGRLTVMASGPAELFVSLRPFLEVLGSNVLLVGDEPGQGQLTKLINNLLSATAVAITAEAVALGVKGGLDPALLLEAINTSSGRNTATADKFPRCVLPRTFDFGFRARLMDKDVSLCLQEANSRKMPMLLATTVQQLWSVAAAELPPEADLTAIAQLIERWAGVTIGQASSE
jgi:3-hydroxyisobutyrate dehydrogenase-like beta-hydroxyacid dehydrogenase